MDNDNYNYVDEKYNTNNDKNVMRIVVRIWGELWWKFGREW